MQTEKNEDSLEKLVIPLYEIVAYPGSRTKFPVESGDRCDPDCRKMADKGTVLHRPYAQKAGPGRLK